MNLLLDTHVLIWWVERSPRLGSRARKTLLSPEVRPIVSAASIWEMAIKAAAGRLDLADPLDSWVPRLRNEWGVHPLAISLNHAAAVRDLPPHHNDPFDRMLVAQAQCEGLTLVTADPKVAAYDIRILNASQ
jgi:PIN domain nuclease of toxin-antitoxin system